jgi:hypothetical protein
MRNEHKIPITKPKEKNTGGDVKIPLNSLFKNWDVRLWT